MSLITFDNKVDSVSNANPRINKVIADDINQLKNGVNYFYNFGGWVRYFDSVHTVGSPQTLTASTDNVITIVDVDPLNDQKPVDLGSDQLWTGNKITPITAGDAYMIRLDFKASIADANGYFDLKIDIDGLIGVIFSRVQNFPKGSGTEHQFSFSELVYTADTFKTNGGNIVINPSAEMTIYDKSILIDRIYKGR